MDSSSTCLPAVWCPLGSFSRLTDRWGGPRLRGTTQLSSSRCWGGTKIFCSCLSILRLPHYFAPTRLSFEYIWGVAGLNLEYCLQVKLTDRCVCPQFYSALFIFFYLIFTSFLFKRSLVEIQPLHLIQTLRVYFFSANHPFFLRICSSSTFFFPFLLSFLLPLAPLPSHVASSSPVPSISTFPHKAVFHRSPCSLE